MQKKSTLLILIACFFISQLAAQSQIDFARDIQPILSDMCFHCHGPDDENREANLRLDTFEGATEKRKHGAAIVPGNAMASEFFQRLITDDENDMMPPLDSNRKLTPDQIALLKDWIDQGAEWGDHWAFIKPHKTEVPAIKNSTWPKNQIDHFIGKNLESLDQQPNDEADKRTLLRRVSLDLTGLPPSPQEMIAFMADTDPMAYEKQVDRLLDSKHYGERMAWPWLDAARYADTNGYQGDRERNMWPWRDWVVKAFNNNMPFDQFTVEQIAGDLLPNANFHQKLATAFLRNHMINGEGGRIPEENRIEYIYDQLETVGTTFLALTFNCCRCHNHKYDTLSQKDYFAFSAFFNQTPITGGEKSGRSPPYISIPPEKELLTKEQSVLAKKEEALKSMRKELLVEYAKTYPTKKDDKKQQDDYLKKNKDFQKAQGAVKHQKQKIDNMHTKIMVMKDNQTRKTYILNSGLYNQPREEVTANTPKALPPLPEGIKADRLALANWIVSKDNPLTARVTMNRFWAQIFGTGLVKTTENFGVQGERPKNQELLDWLAIEFMNSGWNVKHMMRLLVTSASYRQDSSSSKEKIEFDPYNRYLARGVRHRLPSWMIRDQALAASGLLNPEMGGKGVKPYQPAGIWQDMSFGKIKYQQDQGAKLYKRSLYTFWRRIVSPTMFFDIAKRQVCEVEEKRTNTPLHALVTMNDIAYIEAGRALAAKAAHHSSLEERIQSMFLNILGREANQRELNILIESYKSIHQQYQKNPDLAELYLQVGELKTSHQKQSHEFAALANIGLMIINTDEALSKE